MKRKNKNEDACQSCRGDDTRPKCRHCQRFETDCIRQEGRLKFRDWSLSAARDGAFKKDQIWLDQSRDALFGRNLLTLADAVAFQFVDETSEVENNAREHSSETHEPARPGSSESDQNNPKSSELDGQSGLLILSQNEKATASTSFRFGHVLSPKSFVEPQISPQPLSSTMSPTQAVEREYLHLADYAAASIPSASSGFLSPKVWKEKFFWPNQYTTTQCICLMRFYVEELAPWFDASDPASHFSVVVPQRARRCPPLLQAIFTAASRCLPRISKYRTSDGMIVYHGVTLAYLTDETALKYHNACIAYLLKLVESDEYIMDEDLLAAAVILRLYQRLDASLDENTETSPGASNLFIEAQTTDACAISPDGRAIEDGSRLFRHAAFRNAVRQEMNTSCLKQKPLRIPLEAWAPLREFEPAEDVLWTDRLALFLADVLQFCFGPKDHQTPQWSDLKNFQTLWQNSKPFSFTPIYSREPDPTAGDIFPQIWHLGDCQILGTQYFFLASILLTVYDPSAPRLGSRATQARAMISTEVQQLVLKICGVALSNRMSVPQLLNATMAIVLCAEYFFDQVQQNAMIDLVAILETEYAWPTAAIIRDLKATWLWDF